MTTDVRSIWLMPEEEDAAFLSAQVRVLAERYGTPVFTPHLTLRGDTPMAAERLAGMCEQAASEVPAFALPISGIETTAAYFRAFYARFQLAPALVALKRRLDPEEEGAFVPHISLLYGDLTEDAKAPAAVEHSPGLAARSISFDRICVVRSGQDIPIEDWSIISTAYLRG